MENYTVSIDSVEKATGNNSSLEFTPADFNSLTPSSTELTLSDEGLDKVNSATDLADATAYKYDITFKFTTTSDTVSNKTVTSKSTVSLFKVVSVTKYMLIKMIKATPEFTVKNRSDIDGFDDSFKIFSLLPDDAYKVIYINEAAGGGMTGTTRASTFSPNASGLTTIQFGTAETSKFISSSYCNQILISNIYRKDDTLRLNYIFTLKEGYILDDSVSFITNDGININFTLGRVGSKWVED